MGIPTEEFGATFWLSAGAVIVGLVSLLAKFAYKSKCESFSLCFGLFKVKRNIEAEVREDIESMNRQPSSVDETPKGNTTVKIPSLS
jgi:hypothetical protein